MGVPGQVLTCAVMLKNLIIHRSRFEQLLVRWGEEVQPTCVPFSVLWKITAGSEPQQSLGSKAETGRDWGFVKVLLLVFLIVSKHTQVAVQ